MGSREQRALHRAAAKAQLARARRLLDREPSLAATVDPADLRTALHKVAGGISMPTSRQAIAAMLLAAAPQMAAAIDASGRTALHYAASNGLTDLVHQLLAAAPAAITMPDIDNKCPLHYAAARTGGAATVAALLAVAPWTAMATTTRNATPLFEAAHADEESALLLLAEAPAAATIRTTTFLFMRSGWTALTNAAHAGRPRLVAAILEAVPHAALIGDANNDLPLHWASQLGFEPAHAEVRRLLIAAAPEACLVQDRDGDTPLMCAAIQGNAGAVEQLLAAAPAAAGIANNKGQLPIDTALQRCAVQGDAQALESARHLLGAGDTADVAAALGKAAGNACSAAAAAAAQRLAVEFVARRALTAEQWALLPAELPGLGAALPAVLARSEAEAACLMARLPAAERAFVRAAMLSLARLQGLTHLSIPVPALQRIVSLAVEPTN